MVERPTSGEHPVRGSPPRSRWTREQAARIERTEATVAPIIYPPEDTPNPDVHV